MSKEVTRKIANAFIWLGLALIAFGCALAYPFVRDAIQAQSAIDSLTFVITPEPTPTATAAPTSTPTPVPTPAATTIIAAPIVTPIPSPAFLPDNATANPPQVTAQITPQPTATVAGDPPDRIIIPAIQLDAPVVVAGWHVEQIGGTWISVWDVPDKFAAGWLKTSALAGQKGNTVLDGHHNIAGEVFKRLVDLNPKDVIELHANGKVLRYAVTEKHILPDRDQPMQVRVANAQWIQPTSDERLTLVTCWPYTNNTHRLIIVARPANRNDEKGIE